MKKGRVLSLKKTGLFKIANKDKTKIFLFFLLIVGIVFGVFLFSDKHNIGVFIGKFANFYIKSHSYKELLRILLSSFFLFLMIDLVFLVSSISLSGAITIPVFILFLGYAFGNLLSYNYSTYSLKGLAFNAVLIIPVFVSYLIVLVNTAKFSFTFALMLSSTIINNDKPIKVSVEFVTLIKRYLALLLFTILISLVDALLSFYLIKMFEF